MSSSAGCKKPLLRREFLACAICKLRYDLLCANVAEKRYSLMTAENKTQWKCPDCRSKQPKANNTNTPIRQLMELHTGEPSVTVDTIDEPLDGVTMRNKRQLTGVQANRDDDGEEARQPTNAGSSWIGVSEEKLRIIIRQEIAAAVECSIQKIVVGKLDKLQTEINNLKEMVIACSNENKMITASLADKVCKESGRPKRSQEQNTQPMKVLNKTQQHSKVGTTIKAPDASMGLDSTEQVDVGQASSQMDRQRQQEERSEIQYKDRINSTQTEEQVEEAGGGWKKVTNKNKERRSRTSVIRGENNQISYGYVTGY